MKLFKSEKLNNVCKLGLVWISYIALIVLLFMSFKYINKGVISFISVLQPFIIAFVFAYLLNTPWKWTISTLESFKFFKKHTILNKIVSTFVVYIIAISAVVGLIIFIVPQLSDSIILVLGDLPDLLKGIESSLKEFLEGTSPMATFLATYDFSLDSTVYSVINDLIESAKSWGPKVYDGVITVTTFLKDTLLGLFISIYMLFYKEKAIKGLSKMAYAFLPEKWNKGLLHVLKSVDNAFGGFIIMKSIDSVIIGLICFIAMSVFGMEYAVLSSVIVGITNMIPIFGPIFGCIPGAVLLLFTNIVHFWVYLAIILGIQQFDCHVLTPALVSAKIDIPPIWVLFGVIVCGGLMGIGGFFLGVPLVAVIYSLCYEFVEKRVSDKGAKVVTMSADSTLHSDVKSEDAN